RCGLAGLGARIYCHPTRLGDSGAPHTLNYYYVWWCADRYAPMAQPATYGAVGESPATTASCHGGAHPSAEYDGTDSLLCAVGYGRTMRGILVSRICHGDTQSRGLAGRSSYIVFFCHFWIGAPLSWPSWACQHNRFGDSVRNFTGRV